MKKRSYAPRANALPVEWRETIDIHTGEVSEMAVPAQLAQPDYGRLYLAAFSKAGRDPRMTKSAWTIFAALVGHLNLTNNHAQVSLTELRRETGISRQGLSRGLSVLRSVGILAPSQAWGKYHLSAQVIYRCKGVFRAQVLAQQQKGRS